MATNIGTGPQDIPLNQFLGEMAFMDRPPVDFGYIVATSVTDTNVSVGYTSINTTYYKWELPSAGWYRLVSTMRARMWGVTGYLQTRLYNNTTSTALTETTRMMFEQGSNASLINTQTTLEWILEVDEPTTIYQQFSTTDSSANSSIQSDANGYNQCLWYKLK
jgi:hypothetical protein